MSRAGLGSGTVGEVNVAFTGDTTDLNSKAAQAESTIAGVTASTTASASKLSGLLASFTAWGAIAAVAIAAIGSIIGWITEYTDGLEKAKKAQTDLYASLYELAYSPLRIGNVDYETREKERLFKVTVDLDRKAQETFKDNAKGLSDYRAALSQVENDRIKTIEQNAAKLKEEELAKSAKKEYEKRAQIQHDLDISRSQSVDSGLREILQAAAEEDLARSKYSGDELKARLEIIQNELEGKIAAINSASEMQEEADRKVDAKKEEARQEAHRRELDRIDKERRARLDAFREIAEQQSTNLSGITFDPRVGDALELRARQADKTLRIIGGV